MEFTSPQLADFSNVRALNREFLTLLGRSGRTSPLFGGLSAELAARLAALRPAQCDRLAATPFLLFSFRERDDAYWERLFAANGNRDLFDGPLPQAGQVRFVAAGLGFVWQLARQSPYSARLICGASLHWCERLAERTLCDVIALAAGSGDVLVLREAACTALWGKLLDSGVSREREVRKAAHISALQFVLTSVHRGDARRLASAARGGLVPSLKVADEMDR